MLMMSSLVRCLRTVLVIFLALAGQLTLAEDFAEANKIAAAPLSFFEWGYKNSVFVRGHHVNGVNGLNPTFRLFNDFCLNLDAALDTGSDPKVCYFGTNEGGWIDSEAYYYGDHLFYFHIDQFPVWFDLVAELETDDIEGLFDRRGGIRFYLPYTAYGYSDFTFDDKSGKLSVYAGWGLPFLPGEGWEAEIFSSVDFPYDGGRGTRYFELGFYGLNLSPDRKFMIRPFFAMQLPEIDWGFREWLFGVEIAI